MGSQWLLILSKQLDEHKGTRGSQPGFNPSPLTGLRPTRTENSLLRSWRLDVVLARGASTF